MDNLTNYLDELDSANCFFESFNNDLSIDDFSSQDLCIHCILNMMQGTNVTIKNILRERSLKDAQILLRTQIERFIKLKNLCDDQNFAQRYINESQKTRLIFIKNAIENNPEAKGNPLYDPLKEIVTQEILEELSKDVEENGSEISLWALAKQTNLLHQYYLPYRFYSATVHANSSELDDCFFKNGNKIVLIPYGSNKKEELPITALFALHIILEAMSIVAQLKGLDIKENLLKLRTVPGHENSEKS